MTDRASIADAAALTGIPAGTIRRWIADGRVTSSGKPHRVSVSELVQLRDLLARPACAAPAGEQS